MPAVEHSKKDVSIHVLVKFTITALAKYDFGSIHIDVPLRLF